VGSDFEVPYLTDEQFRQKAQEFLDQHHPEGIIPVPIEWIVEAKLGIFVQPLPGLHEHFDIDGYLSRTLKTVVVDQFFFDKRPNRYRFTLAHEIAHLLLHADIYRRASFETFTEWKQFQMKMEDATRGRFEYQAYRLAGLILIPLNHLRNEADRCVRLVRDKGFDVEREWDPAWTAITEELGARFEVSTQAAAKALEVEGVKDGYRRA